MVSSSRSDVLPCDDASLSFALTLFVAGSLNARWIPLNPVAKVDRRPDGIVFTLQTGELRVQVCTDSIIHITYSPVT
jgi:hypothetical protein